MDQEINVKNLNMGSNGQDHSYNKDNVQEEHKEKENEELDQEIDTNKAVHKPKYEVGFQKFAEKDGKNLSAAHIENPFNKKANEQDQSLNDTIKLPEAQAIEQPIDEAEELKSLKDQNETEEVKKMDELCEATEIIHNPPNEVIHQPIIEPKPENNSESPNKSETIEEKNERERRYLLNLSSNPIMPRRALRERKTRTMRNNDSVSKCHICEKNSYRATLIPCTQGADECEIYF